MDIIRQPLAEGLLELIIALPDGSTICAIGEVLYDICHLNECLAGLSFQSFEADGAERWQAFVDSLRG